MPSISPPRTQSGKRAVRSADLNRCQLRGLRSGFTADDVSSVSDRLFDAITAWGDEETVLRRVNEHSAASADHVCVQVLTADPGEFPREQWHRLAAALA